MREREREGKLAADGGCFAEWRGWRAGERLRGVVSLGGRGSASEMMFGITETWLCIALYRPGGGLFLHGGWARGSAERAAGKRKKKIYVIDVVGCK